MLEVDTINTYYGDAHILHDLSLGVDEDEIVGLLGRNGAGKTTTLRSIMGLRPPRTGSITFKGKQINGDVPEHIYRKGIGYISESRDIFPDLTVRENLLVGLGSDRDESEAFDQVFDYFPRLEERFGQNGGTLSGGEQQMLAIARTMVSDPELLLIDEPTEGLMPALIDTISEIIVQLNEDGHTILLVEQNIDLVLDIADRVYVVGHGEAQFHGTPNELNDREDVIEQYLAV